MQRANNSTYFREERYIRRAIALPGSWERRRNVPASQRRDATKTIGNERKALSREVTDGDHITLKAWSRRNVLCCIAAREREHQQFACWQHTRYLRRWGSTAARSAAIVEQFAQASFGP